MPPREEARPACCRGWRSRAAFCADHREERPTSQVLIGQIGQDREINAVFGKGLRVLGHAELLEQIRHLSSGAKQIAKIEAAISADYRFCRKSPSIDLIKFFQRHRCGFQTRTWGTSSSTSDSTETVLNRSAAAISVNRRCRCYFGRFATTLDLRLFQQNRPKADLARGGLFEDVVVELAGITEPLRYAERRAGRRTARTFPLLPPPQKNVSLPFDSSPDTPMPGGMSI